MVSRVPLTCRGWVLGADEKSIRCSILCGDYAIKLIEEPFVSDADDPNEWAL